MSHQNQEITYDRAKTWQIGLFALNNTATNIFYFLMMYVSYYANGVAGIAVVTVSFLLTAMRIFDGITDPIIGVVIDKTSTKFGKFRPLMIIGNVIIFISILILFNTVHVIPEALRVPYFTLIYAIYIIGYTCQTACTRAAQATLTNDPKQRPLFSLFDGIYTTFLFTGVTIYTSNYLIGKYGDFTRELFVEFSLTAVITAFILTILAMIGIAGKDKEEFYGKVEEGPKVKFKDYITIFKGNKALRMLIVASSTTKLTSGIASNATVLVIVFGIIAGDFSLNGTVTGLTTIPSLFVLMYITRSATKLGQRKAIILATWASVITYSIIGFMIISGSMGTLNFGSLNMFTIIFSLMFILMKGFTNAVGALTIPMIADCADYQVYIDGKQVPGMMATMFSFIDKMVSSLSVTVVGLVLAGIGFGELLPTVDTPLTSQLLNAGVLLYAGLPVAGYIISLIAFKFYPLTAEKMQEIQRVNQQSKNNKVV